MVKYSPIEAEFASSEEEAAEEAWLCAKAEQALAPNRPTHTHEDVMAQMRAIIAKYERRKAEKSG